VAADDCICREHGGLTRFSYAFTVGTSAMLVVQEGGRTSDRNFHSRLNRCSRRSGKWISRMRPGVVQLKLRDFH
jgi:hypothetical protein